jgi:hypothetical protein
VNSDAPEASTENAPGANPRHVLIRRLEFVAIAVGGAFIILGWGIGHQEWARALGWIFAGIGFAIEMVHGRVLKPARRADAAAERPVDDESAS